MAATSATFPPPHTDSDWRSLRMLAWYRWAISLGAIGLVISGRSATVIPGVEPLLLYMAGMLYLIVAVGSSVTALVRIPGIKLQTLVNVVCDLVLLNIMLYASRGISSGLGLLIIAPVAGASSITSNRIANLLAALATLGLLGGEVLRSLLGQVPEADYMRSGFYGVLLFIACIATNALAFRARRSEARAQRSQLNLANMAQLNAHIIARMGTAVVVIDNDGRIRTANETARELFALPANPVGKLIRDHNRELDELVRGWLANTPAEEVAQTCTMQERKLLLRCVALQASDPPALMLLAEDTAHIDARAQQMKLAALGRLTASIAHEIRNPLSAISQAQQLLSDWPNEADEEQRLLAVINRQSARINQIIEDVLSLSRREPLNPVTLPLAQTVTQLAEEYRQLATHPPTIDYSESEPGLQLQFDANHLRRVLHNLWDNSCRHAAAGTDSVHIDLHASRNGTLRLDIHDNGPGIPAREATHIFEPFYTTRHSGVGLGLYIVRELCELNGARISLVESSTPGACLRIQMGGDKRWAA